MCCSCWSTLSGTDWERGRPALGRHSVGSLGRNTAALLSDLTQGASNWIYSFLEPGHIPGGRRSPASTMRRSQSDQTFRTTPDVSTSLHRARVGYPEGFQPLRSECQAFVSLTSCPIFRNPFVSPLLAPKDLLRGLPPVHIVVRDERPTTWAQHHSCDHARTHARGKVASRCERADGRNHFLVIR